MKNICRECGAPVPMGAILPVRRGGYRDGRLPDTTVSGGGTLHRDEYGMSASYYGRVTQVHHYGVCADPQCAMYAKEIS